MAVAPRTRARVSALSSSAPQRVTVRLPPTACSTSSTCATESARTIRLEGPNTSSRSSVLAMKFTASTWARKGRGASALPASCSRGCAPAAAMWLTPASKAPRMPGVSMAWGFCVARAVVRCCTNASLAGSLSRTITPGLVQNWPQPREMEPASTPANSAPRAARMPGRATTGLVDPSSP